MKRLLPALMLLCLILAAKCLAEGISLPRGMRSVESEAFCDAQAQWAFIPDSCVQIAPDAFSDSVTLICGFGGSAAESYAAATGRRFLDVGIYGAAFSCPALCLPKAEISVSAKAECAVNLTARFSLCADGTEISSSETGKLRAGETGSFDLHVVLSNAYYSEEYVVRDAVRVIEKPKTACDSFDVPLGKSVKILSDEETRSCKVTLSSTRALSLSEGCLTGLKTGEYSITVTVSEGGFTLSETYPVSVYVPADEIRCELPEFGYAGEKVALNYTVLPEDAKFRQADVTSSNPDVISTDEQGVLVFLSEGEAEISVFTRDVLFRQTVRCVPQPEGLALAADEDVLAVNGILQLTPVLTPAGALARLQWLSADEGVAAVDFSGAVTGISPGSTVVTCRAGDLTASVPVTVKTAPQKVRISADLAYMHVGESKQLELHVSPIGTELDTILWQSSDESVAAVDQNGFVTARSAGQTVVSARALSRAEARFTVHVTAYEAAIGLDLGTERRYVEPGGQISLAPQIYPAGAEAELIWSSSDESVLTVDQGGVVTGITSGTATVTCALKDDPNVSASAIVNVLSDKRCLVMPLRRTGISGIQGNLARIDAVKRSAENELKSVYARGLIGEKELNGRLGAIGRVFESYAFAWMTPAFQPYWDTSVNEGGIKDFEPGVVYYGLPYISGDYGLNRAYDVRKALRENRYYASEDGDYYLMNPERFISGNYIGCDCSTLISISFWGVGQTASEMRTGALYRSTDFKTLSYTDELFPGDIIVASNRHVVMFLYYANDEHTQIVTIEQGGDEHTVNTVSASVYPIEFYSSRGYAPRRKKYW